ncbi:RNA polymerase, sigma 28 subunit, SigK [Alicyclobacillus hesperidum URH17-3-68]|nr:RNA polymerase, sigma 28 subunit, SigK [Alicyclobacillus hesperidum URH17-3-68]
MVGWDKRKLVTYVKRGVFPEPHIRLASGPIWTKLQIERYLKQNRIGG